MRIQRMEGEKRMKEAAIERKLVEAAKKRKGLCLKWVSPGYAGVPDRIVLLPHGRIGFVEVKAPGEKPRKLQVSRHRLLRRLGFGVYVLDRPDDIEKILDDIEEAEE